MMNDNQLNTEIMNKQLCDACSLLKSHNLIRGLHDSVQAGGLVMGFFIGSQRAAIRVVKSIVGVYFTASISLNDELAQCPLPTMQKLSNSWSWGGALTEQTIYIDEAYHTEHDLKAITTEQREALDEMEFNIRVSAKLESDFNNLKDAIKFLFQMATPSLKNEFKDIQNLLN